MSGSHRGFRWGVALVFLLLLTHQAFGVTIRAADGLTVTVDASGSYAVTAPELGWSFAGSVGAPLSNLQVTTGADNLGAYGEISFRWRSGIDRTATIRAWTNLHAALFGMTASAAAANTVSFPSFSQYPGNVFQLTYSGPFAKPLFGSSVAESPWIFFDSSRNTYILSPANNFMAASIAWSPNGELASGIAPQIGALPPGFQHQTLLVLKNGINQTFDEWGQVLLALRGKTPPPNDADATLNKVGYWTDNGAAYYYQTQPGLSYEQTLSAVKAGFDSQGIGLGYVQLDSWFYPKGLAAIWNDGASGIFEYVAAPALFPDGLTAFQNRLGVPLVTHARWIDSSSPYRAVYQMSGNVVLDSAYWNSVADYLAGSGVATYEQDWLDGNAQTRFNLADPNSFLGNMAAAMAERKMTIQYCMASPRHLLQSSRYGNVTSARVSFDGFAPSHWNHFLYTSRLASALGIWPFTDVFRSSERDNLLVATLSAGPIGLGDPIGALNAQNLLRAVRKDGVIVKPDVPLTPIDSSFLNTAQGIDAPLISSTYSDFGGLRTHYILAYNVGSNHQATFHLADLGIEDPVYLYADAAGNGRVAEPADLISAPVNGATEYWIAAPVGPSGIAILGDTGQFVSMGKKRIPQISDDGAVQITVAFAEGEPSRVIQGYAPSRPVAWATSGSVSVVSYNPARHLFQVTISPGAGGTASIGVRLHHRSPIPAR